MPEGPRILDFWQAALTLPLARNALTAALFVSLCCGIVGAVVRRISYIAAGVTHRVLGGLGAACYLNGAWGSV